MIPWFDVPALEFGPFDVEGPSLIAIFGAILALVHVYWRCRKVELSGKRAVDGVFLGLACAFVMGHAFDVLLYRQAELRMDWKLILPWYGGSCSLGAFIGFASATAIVFRKPRGGLDLRYFDEAVFAVVLALAVLRFGCFLGHHHAGRLSTFVLAVKYPKGARHDLGLYETLLALVLLGGLAYVKRSFRGARAGLITGNALLFYGLVRFALEFLRGDDIESIGRHSDPRYFGLTMAQHAALVMMAVGAWFLRSERDSGNGLRNPEGSAGLL